MIDPRAADIALTVCSSESGKRHFVHHAHGHSSPRGLQDAGQTEGRQGLVQESARSDLGDLACRGYSANRVEMEPRRNGSHHRRVGAGQACGEFGREVTLKGLSCPGRPVAEHLQRAVARGLRFAEIPRFGPLALRAVHHDGQDPGAAPPRLYRVRPRESVRAGDRDGWPPARQASRRAGHGALRGPR